MDGLSASELDDLLRRFLAEDVGPGDVTTDSIVPEDAVAAAEIVAKSECVVSGLPISRRVFELLDPDLEWEDRIATGATAPPATITARTPRTIQRFFFFVIKPPVGCTTDTRPRTECSISDRRGNARPASGRAPQAVSFQAHAFHSKKKSTPGTDLDRTP